MRVFVVMEESGRFIAEVPGVPGSLAYGLTEHEAVQKAIAVASSKDEGSMDIDSLLHHEQFPPDEPECGEMRTTEPDLPDIRTCVVCGFLTFHDDAYESPEADYTGCYACRTVRENTRLHNAE